MQQTVDISKIKTILATDCGSTTTKAILIEEQDGVFRLIKRGEAPTTVEAPAEDVTRGVINAVGEIEDLTGRKFIKDDAVWVRDNHRLEAGATVLETGATEGGCDIYVGTSSAGGGLQMMVAGVVKSMTAESAQRAALGAGAIVMDSLATNDGRLAHERIERIRRLRPDMILLSGGTDGGTIKHVVEMSQMIAAADPRPRFGATFQLPVIFSGNNKAHDEVKRILGEKCALSITENLRPTLESENLRPARDRIHDLFLEHVMAQAPGYGKLMTWTSVPIMPTPGAVGLIMQLIAEREKIQVVGVDIGGATTDIFSVFRQDKDDPDSETIFNRTVSANLGMSYSISNVVAEAGFENIVRWVPLDVDERDIRNRIRNKMIRPTTIPQTLDELMIEQAICREALRLAFIQHGSMAVGLKGVQQQRTIADTFEQGGSGESLVDMMGLNMIIGSGGVLSHSPRRCQAAMMVMDGFQPLGFTELTVDSIFMMPQLGVLSTVHEKAAIDVFEKDCLIRLGWCIAPRGTAKDGAACMKVEVSGDGGSSTHEMKFGDLKLIPLEPGQKATVTVTPAKGFDIGGGKNTSVTQEVTGGVVGLILDARGRPLALSENRETRLRKLNEWIAALDMYPKL